VRTSPTLECKPPAISLTLWWRLKISLNRGNAWRTERSNKAGWRTCSRPARTKTPRFPGRLSRWSTFSAQPAILSTGTVQTPGETAEECRHLRADVLQRQESIPRGSPARSPSEDRLGHSVTSMGRNTSKGMQRLQRSRSSASGQGSALTGGTCPRALQKCNLDLLARQHSVSSVMMSFTSIDYLPRSLLGSPWLDGIT